MIDRGGESIKSRLEINIMVKIRYQISFLGISESPTTFSMCYRGLFFLMQDFDGGARRGAEGDADPAGAGARADVVPPRRGGPGAGVEAADLRGDRGRAGRPRRRGGRLRRAGGDDRRGGDLQQVTRVARRMVTAFGMSEIGPWALAEPAAQGGDVVLRMLARSSMSERLAADIDAAVRTIVDEAYEVAKAHVRRNRAAIDQLVDVLMEKETLGGDEFRAILSEHVDIGKERRETAARTEQLATA